MALTYQQINDARLALARCHKASLSMPNPIVRAAQAITGIPHNLVSFVDNSLREFGVAVKSGGLNLAADLVEELGPQVVALVAKTLRERAEKIETTEA